MPRDRARAKPHASRREPPPPPIERLTAHLTRAFFDGSTEPLSEQEFEGPYRDLARLANLFARASRRAIDAARAAEAAVREREARLKLVIQCSSDAIIAFDGSRRALFANPAWLERTGIPFEEITGAPESYVVDEDREAFRAQLDAAYGGAPVRAEYRVRGKGKEGAERWIVGHWRPVSDAAKRTVGVVGVERDETQQREAAERDRTARRLESLGRLAGGIAHDFNNLLTVVTVQLDALNEHLKVDRRGREIVLPMEAATARAADLVRQLLMFGRRTPTASRRFDLRDAVRETVELLRRTIGDAYPIELEMPETAVAIEGDHSQLTQVVLNLCLNARDAMAHGGPIDVRLRAERSASNGRAILEVADRGTGIAPEARERLFEPFFTTKDVGRGTGLGLALVHEIVNRHRGAISVSTVVGAGSRFLVALPLAAAEAPPPAAAAKAGASHGSPRRAARVLLVEADEEVRGVLRGCLEREGHQVFVARNRREALALADGSARGFDVLVTSATLPDAAGAEVARSLALTSPAFGVVVATGSAVDRSGRGVEPAIPGARVLPKPFAVTDLRVVLAEAIAAADAGRRNGSSRAAP